MKKLSILIFLALALSAEAQDPHFSQFHNNAMYLNPAFAGSRMVPEIAVSYRNQWPDLTGTFVTTIASYNQFINKINSGVGAYALFDQAGEGTFNSSSFNLVYAYHKEIKSVAIQVAATGGYRERHLDWDKLTFGDMIDPRYGFVYSTPQAPPKSKVSYFDFGTGVLCYTKNLYAGFSVEHLTEPEESFIRPAPGSRLPRRYSVNVGYAIAAGDAGKWIINPDVIYLSQRDFSEWVYGLTAKYDWLRAGVSIRHNDAIILSAGIDTGNLLLSYSYDITTSLLRTYSGGSHEFGAAYRFINKSKASSKMQLSAVAF